MEPNQSSEPAPELFAPGPRLQQRFPVLFGPRGLRAGWRALLFFAGWSVALRVTLLPVQWLASRDLLAFTPAWVAALEWWWFFSVLLTTLIAAWMERRSVGDYGLPWRSAFGPRFWEGVVWGLAGLSLLLLLLRATHSFDFGTMALHGRDAFRFGAWWAVVFLGVGFFEEFSLRGYLQFALSRSMGFWPAAVLLSAVFGLGHLRNPGENLIGAADAALLGLFLCLTLRRTGTLWFAVGFHAAFDWGETFLYGVPNSGHVLPGHLFNPHFQGPAWLTGGSVGPEGSVFSFLMAALLWVGANYRFREARYPANP